MSKSKQIGTAAETLAVRFMRANGFPGADRRPLKGNQDQGDILLEPRVIAEVKGGHAAEDASPGQIVAWMRETATEGVNAGAEVAFLVVKRKGAGAAKVGTWNTFWPLSTLYRLRGYPFKVASEDAIVSMSLESALAQLRFAGYGVVVS